jgi:hypothetical protein
MNLQNIPEGDEAEGLPNIRKLFITDEEPEPMEFFDIDLDLLTSASLFGKQLSRNEAMLAEGLKPYVEVAKEYYHDPSIESIIQLILNSKPSATLPTTLAQLLAYPGVRAGTAY